MAFIREKEEIKTGFQEIEPWSSEIDLQTDFVMVYGLNESLESRMQQYRERGYKVHLMGVHGEIIKSICAASGTERSTGMNVRRTGKETRSCTGSIRHIWCRHCLLSNI